jgi:hypothetical protein
VSISLPGLARFGCDLSATVGGIPNFGKKSASRKLVSKRGKEGASQALSTDCRPRLWADSRPIISPGMSGIHQSNRQLRPYPWPRSPLAAAADRAFVGARNSRAAIPNPSWLRIGMRTAISNAFLCGGLATAGRSQRIAASREQTVSDNFTSWSLWAADAAVNALLGLRRCRQ